MSTCDWDLSIFGVLEACSHLLVCLVKIVALLNIAVTWLSKSNGIAIPLFDATDNTVEMDEPLFLVKMLTYFRQGTNAVLHVKSLRGTQPRTLRYPKC